jgi:hypothetical protein
MITTQQQSFNADPIIDNEPSLDCTLIPNNTQKSNFYLYKSIGDIFFNTMPVRHEKIFRKFSFQKYIIIRIFHKYYIPGWLSRTAFDYYDKDPCSIHVPHFLLDQVTRLLSKKCTRGVNLRFKKPKI